MLAPLRAAGRRRGSAALSRAERRAELKKGRPRPRPRVDLLSHAQPSTNHLPLWPGTKHQAHPAHLPPTAVHATMPTVTVDKQLFFKSIGAGAGYTSKEFDELCFQFGIELDEDTELEAAKDGQKLPHGTRPELKIDIPANRYDMLCHEGISRALNVYLGRAEPPQYRLAIPKTSDGKPLEIHVTANPAQVRPFIQGAVLRGVKFTPENYANFIDLQDKLHQNLARRRTLVAIGTHDLDTITGPFTYDAKPPKDIKFAPLNRTEEVDGNQLMSLYEHDSHLKPYLPIIRDKPVYPVVLDSKGTVCSLPPIINSNHSKISLNTTDVFIEATAIDETRLAFAMNILVTMFSEYCADPFTIEPVNVVYPDGKTHLTPDLSSRKTSVKASYINSCAGLQLKAEEIAALLVKMGHQTHVPQGTQAGPESEIEVEIPCTRPDVLAGCDLLEDAAVAYGFDNLKRRFPEVGGVGRPLPINKLGDLVRTELALAGWIEVLSLILCSEDENFGAMRKQDDGSAVKLENPKTNEFGVVRTSLLPGLLKTVRENRKHALPLRLFEVQDIVTKTTQTEADSTSPHFLPDAVDLGAKNQRHAAVLYSNRMANFEIVHGALDQLLRKLEVPRIHSQDADTDYGWYLEQSSEPTFWPVQCASIVYRPKSQSEEGQAAAGTSALETLGTKLAATLPGQQANAQEIVGGVDELINRTAASVSLRRKPKASNPKASNRDRVIGTIGVIHPEVLQQFSIDYPCSAFEVDIEAFL